VCCVDVLLDQNDRANVDEPRESRTDLSDDHRGDALGRFVQQHDLRPGDQGLRDGEHLSLSTGQCLSLLTQALAQYGKEFHDFLPPLSSIARARRDSEMLFDAESGKHGRTLGYPAQANARATMPLPHSDIATEQAHFPRSDGKNAHESAQQRRLSRSVSSDDANSLAVAEIECDAAQDLGPPVRHVDGVHTQELLSAHASRPR
jgi:hypothetical protein